MNILNFIEVKTRKVTAPHRNVRQIPDLLYCRGRVTTLLVEGVKFGLLGFLPGTHAKTNTKHIPHAFNTREKTPKIFTLVNLYAHTTADSGDTHLTNHSYYDYG